MRIQRAQREESAVAMSGIGYGSESTEVIDPVEVGGLKGNVVAGEKEVNGVRVFGAEGRRERTADPGGGGGRAELGVLSDGREKRWSEEE
jgi:hypothetical protein